MTYDQWKATDPAGDDADVRKACCSCSEGARVVDDGDGHVDVIDPADTCACVCHAKRVRCRSCGAEFANPYGGGAEAALCDACLDKKPTDEQLAKLRR